jgi:hypothetical protein
MMNRDVRLLEKKMMKDNSWSQDIRQQGNGENCIIRRFK